MRALFLNHNVVGRGTWQRVSCLARELAALGHDITVLTTSRNQRMTGRERDWSGVRVIEAPDLLFGGGRAGWDLWNSTWRVRRLARERFDLIHAFDCRPVVILPALMQRRRNDAPLFLDWADWWGRGGIIVERSGWPVRTFFGPIETWFEESFRTGATANTTINETLRQRCIALGVAGDRVMALPDGCAPRAALSKEDARATLGLSDSPLIVHLGVMHKADAALLFEAYRVVLRRLPRARLVLIGPYAGTVPADLRSIVHRTGYVDGPTMQQWLAAADIGVIPFRDTIANRGRWPGKLSEYLAAGLPVAMPAVGSAAELIAGAGAGAVCEPTADRLGSLVADTLLDGAARARMAVEARRLAAGELAWGRIARRLLSFYEKWSDAAA